MVITGTTVIAAIGFTGSYAALRELALTQGFGAFSYLLPVGIDAGICVLLALDLLLTWIRIPFPLLRQTAWLLTAATIAFNGAAAWPDPLGVGMHAVIPVLFVVAVEAARHAVGRIADITADKHMEGVRLTRWLLSPIPTFLLWRRMKLWELRSYEQVIKLEQERLVYQARLHARFGRAWRRKAPVESLMPLRLARYGVPLAETAPAGLAAAGIENPPAHYTAHSAAAPTTPEPHDAAPQTPSPQAADLTRSHGTQAAHLARSGGAADGRPPTSAASSPPSPDVCRTRGPHPPGITATPDSPQPGRHLRVPSHTSQQHDEAGAAQDTSPAPKKHRASAAPDHHYNAALDRIGQPGATPNSPNPTAERQAAPPRTNDPASRSAAHTHTASRPDTDPRTAPLTLVDRYYLAWTQFQSEHRREPSTAELSHYLSDHGIHGRPGSPVKPATLRRYPLSFRLYTVWAEHHAQTGDTPDADIVAKDCTARGITGQYNKPITTHDITAQTSDFERRRHALAGHPIDKQT
ncbi:DUF2637 domain-containing protein [Streptomyces collinus]|uniref:DUF2637 domain-containing protein n=1 Tax=Streptomyces collinus TaxID=42684 RepID=UPI003636704A